ncbi:MAG TPA: hypothetical protein VFA81_09480 [Burkholderiales bacterium]|nr:hypothetical protein [Burkholderiales bacterium]
MIGPILDFDDLRGVSRLGERATLATVERWAKKIGLRYSYDARGGIWTTIDAMNVAVGLTTVLRNADDMYRTEDII